MAIPIILDCDPGTDDAFALLLALASPELEVLAVTVAGGNVGLECTLPNALALVALAGVNVPVYTGPIGHCSAPSSMRRVCTVSMGLAASPFRRGRCGIGRRRRCHPRDPAQRTTARDAGRYRAGHQPGSRTDDGTAAGRSCRADRADDGRLG